uniref:Uncharacterized protein n=1 Tax=Picea glauca TaxID=3330 RepID=A0A117NIK0_PICGL|nr:hypothetical protein ABT39_MTgene3245 [Picea glauca]QHR89255.1 hypothetical protein Q903MT_gene3275 [Picea sitchensis]
MIPPFRIERTPSNRETNQPGPAMHAYVSPARDASGLSDLSELESVRKSIGIHSLPLLLPPLYSVATRHLFPRTSKIRIAEFLGHLNWFRNHTFIWIIVAYFHISTHSGGVMDDPP